MQIRRIKGGLFLDKMMKKGLLDVGSFIMGLTEWKGASHVNMLQCSLTSMNKDPVARKNFRC
jgi:hypothetical protein